MHSTILPEHARFVGVLKIALQDFIKQPLSQVGTFDGEHDLHPLVKVVQVMNPYDLQKLVAALLRVMGDHVSWNARLGRTRESILWRTMIP